jgi:hypothetical protein
MRYRLTESLHRGWIETQHWGGGGDEESTGEEGTGEERTTSQGMIWLCKKFRFYWRLWNHGSSGGAATGYWLHGWWIGFRFPLRTRGSRRDYSPGVKLLELEAYHSPATSTEVKNTCTYTSTLPYALIEQFLINSSRNFFVEALYRTYHFHGGEDLYLTAWCCRPKDNNINSPKQNIVSDIVSRCLELKFRKNHPWKVDRCHWTLVLHSANHFYLCCAVVQHVVTPNGYTSYYVHLQRREE